MQEYAVYILLCADGTFYTGVTRDIEKRVSEHEHAAHPFAYTAIRRPVRLVYSQCFDNIEQAIRCEKQVKKWSHAKKQALIDGDFQLLHRLARGRNNSHSENKGVTGSGNGPRLRSG